MAQWKRAGPITQRSEDQNLALLGILLLIKRMSEDVKLLSVYLFSTNQIKAVKVREEARNKNIDRLHMAFSTCWCPRVKS